MNQQKTKLNFNLNLTGYQIGYKWCTNHRIKIVFVPNFSFKAPRRNKKKK